MKNKQLVNALRKRYGLEKDICTSCKKSVLKNEMENNVKFEAYGRICNACAEKIDA